jgi:hypothetical protein
MASGTILEEAFDEINVYILGAANGIANSQVLLSVSDSVLAKFVG